MQTYETLKHTTWECKYHVVFISKYRKKVLYGQLKRELRPVLRELAQQKESEIIEWQLMVDHVHMLVVDTAEVFGGAGDGICEGKKRHSHSLSVCRSEEEFVGQNFWARGY